MPVLKASYTSSLKPRGRMRDCIPVCKLSSLLPLAILFIQSANSLIISTQLMLQSFLPLPGHLRRICTQRLPHGLSQVLPYLSLTHTAKSRLISLTHTHPGAALRPSRRVRASLALNLLLITLQIPENIVFGERR
jgi:hypothetical protein